MNGKQKVFNLIILDESGSMSSIKEATIRGFNEVVQTVKGLEGQFPDQEHFISLVTFNGLDIKTLLFNEPVKLLEEIDGNKYRPNSMTPLYDAMGFSITKIQKELETVNDPKVLVTVLTDGEENDSKEYNGESIANLVAEMKKKGWVFTYIGANHDVEKFALSINITNTMSYQANDADMKKMFAREKKARTKFSERISKNINLMGKFYDDDPEIS